MENSCRKFILPVNRDRARLGVVQIRSAGNRVEQGNWKVRSYSNCRIVTNKSARRVALFSRDNKSGLGRFSFLSPMRFIVVTFGVSFSSSNSSSKVVLATLSVVSGRPNTTRFFSLPDCCSKILCEHSRVGFHLLHRCCHRTELLLLVVDNCLLKLNHTHPMAVKLFFTFIQLLLEISHTDNGFNIREVASIISLVVRSLRQYLTCSLDRSITLVTKSSTVSSNRFIVGLSPSYFTSDIINVSSFCPQINLFKVVLKIFERSRRDLQKT
eukprot:sb/3468195/